MKKDYLILNNNDDEKIEIFYLGGGSPTELPHEYHYNSSKEDCGVPAPLEINEDLPLPQDCQEWKELQDLSPPPFHDDVYNDEGVVSEIKGCCPVGPKGESGPTGLYEEELVIKNVLDQLQDSQINMASEQARIFLVREIAKDLRIGGFLKDIYTQF